MALHTLSLTLHSRAFHLAFASTFGVSCISGGTIRYPAEQTWDREDDLDDCSREVHLNIYTREYYNRREVWVCSATYVVGMPLDLNLVMCSLGSLGIPVFSLTSSMSQRCISYCRYGNVKFSRRRADKSSALSRRGIVRFATLRPLFPDLPQEKALRRISHFSPSYHFCNIAFRFLLLQPQWRDGLVTDASPWSESLSSEFLARSLILPFHRNPNVIDVNHVGDAQGLK